jgi:hypothetical protein
VCFFFSFVCFGFRVLEISIESDKKKDNNTYVNHILFQLSDRSHAILWRQRIWRVVEYSVWRDFQLSLIRKC